MRLTALRKNARSEWMILLPYVDYGRINIIERKIVQLKSNISLQIIVQFWPSIKNSKCHPRRRVVMHGKMSNGRNCISRKTDTPPDSNRESTRVTTDCTWRTQTVKLNNWVINWECHFRTFFTFPGKIRLRLSAIRVGQKVFYGINKVWVCQFSLGHWIMSIHSLFTEIGNVKSHGSKDENDFPWLYAWHFDTPMKVIRFSVSFLF